MDGHHVGPRQQLVERDLLGQVPVLAVVRQIGIAGDDAHLERARLAGAGGADRAEADDAERLAGQLHAAAQLLARPLAGHQPMRVEVGAAAQQDHGHGDGVLGRPTWRWRRAPSRPRCRAPRRPPRRCCRGRRRAGRPLSAWAPAPAVPCRPACGCGRSGRADRAPASPARRACSTACCPSAPRSRGVSARRRRPVSRNSVMTMRVIAVPPMTRTLASPLRGEEDAPRVSAALLLA